MLLHRALLALAAILVVSRPVVSSSLPCRADEDENIDTCAHTSLLQTSLTLEKQATDLAPEHVAATAQQAKGGPAGLTGHQRAKVAIVHASLLTSAHGSRQDAQNHTLFLLLIASLVIVTVALFVYLSPGQQERYEEAMTPRAEPEVQRPRPFDDDVYMMSIALIVRDWQTLAKGGKNPGLPISRMIYSVALLTLTLFITVGLILCTKAFVTPQQVASIRDSYDTFEQHMYPDHTRVLEATGKHRGNPGFYNVSLFESLPDKRKGEVCQIPFSQMKFLVLILLVWTISCVAQIARCCSYMNNLLVRLPNISSMADATFDGPNFMRRKKIICGLTITAKLTMLFVVFLPWLGSTSYLLYLGCRWLTATNDFGNFLSNGMALEFMLQFKSVMYYAVASSRMKRDVECTKHVPPTKAEAASFMSYYSAILWGLASVAWVYLYIFYIQSVLPEYQWDVHEPCTPYLAGTLRPS